MLSQLDPAVLKGCDNADPDNMDGSNGDNGIVLTQADAVDHVHFLVDAAYAGNLSPRSEERRRDDPTGIRVDVVSHE